ncbi:MAG: hypothetical protein WKF78_12830 [Candidatus Limnocylindrales bacterium]
MRLIAHLTAQGMPTGRPERQARACRVVRRRAARTEVKPTTLSLEFRALQQFLQVGPARKSEIERSPMERMKAPRVPDSPVPVISTTDFRKLLKTAEGRDYIDRRDMAILLVMFDTGMRRGEVDRAAGRRRRPQATAWPTSPARAATSVRSGSA